MATVPLTGPMIDPAMQPETYANPLVDALIRGAGRIAMIPGQVMQSQTPVTTGDLIKPAADMALSTTLGAGAVPAEANALRAGIRTYKEVPDSLMGFRKTGPQKGFDESAYPHVQDVEVVLPGTKHSPPQVFRDQIRGMNPNHAYERAWRNWPDALHITPVSE